MKRENEESMSERDESKKKCLYDVRRATAKITPARDKRGPDRRKPVQPTQCRENI
jgi:hypothetical protein